MSVYLCLSLLSSFCRLKSVLRGEESQWEWNFLDNMTRISRSYLPSNQDGSDGHCEKRMSELIMSKRMLYKARRLRIKGERWVKGKGPVLLIRGKVCNCPDKKIGSDRSGGNWWWYSGGVKMN